MCSAQPRVAPLQSEVSITSVISREVRKSPHCACQAFPTKLLS